MKKQWRGLMTGLLGVTMVFGSLSSVSAAPVPKDIAGHWAQGQLQQWLDNGYLGGYPDGTVKPNKAITRGEYVALTNRVFGFSDKASISFKDVKSSNWVYSEVAKAVKAGYIGGYENNTFRPNNPITRQEAAVIAAKVLSLQTGGSTAKFKDNAQIAAWSRGAVAAAADKKIINGYPDGTFGPKKSLTRAEAVGIISNSIPYKTSSGGTGVLPTPTPTATPAPATPTPTPTTAPGTGTGGGSGGGGGGGSVTSPTVTGLTYGNVGAVTADVYLTPSVTGAVYYVVAPFNSNATVPTALQVTNGTDSAGKALSIQGKKATTAGNTVSLSVYGLTANTEYTAYVTVADASGNYSSVSSLQLKTAAGTASSLTLLAPGQAGSVTADVYYQYGQTGGAAVPVRYVVLKDTEADPTAAQIAEGKDSKGTTLSAPWSGLLPASNGPGVRHTLALDGLAADTGYKVYFITGTAGHWSPVEMIRIHTTK